MQSFGQISLCWPLLLLTLDGRKFSEVQIKVFNLLSSFLQGRVIIKSRQKLREFFFSVFHSEAHLLNEYILTVFLF